MHREEFERVAFDVAEYKRRSRNGVCFICAILAGHPGYPAHVIYRDERHVAFLNRWPTVRGYALLAPVEHREDVVDGFTLQEYLELQAAVHRLGRAIRAVVPTERLYVLSLGSRQGNSHVHWHLAPLPPGVPYERQQFAALMAERAGVLPVTDAEQAALAAEIAAALRPRPGPAPAPS
jgi:diadenosine tetraphosphate (Ap4A) HIT family hydrolase